MDSTASLEADFLSVLVSNCTLRSGTSRRSPRSHARTLGLALRDILLTCEEYQAMAAGLADSDAPATRTIMLNDWMNQHKTGSEDYAHELRRHFLRTAT
jgi:hypothetical protein